MDNKRPQQSKAPNAQQKQQQPLSKTPQSQPGKAAPAQPKKPGSSW